MAKVPIPMSDSEKRYEAARIELAVLYGSMRHSHLNAIIRVTMSTKHLNKDMARDGEHSEEGWAFARRAIGPLIAALDTEIFSCVTSRNVSKLDRVDRLLDMCQRLRDVRTAVASGTDEARSALRALAQRCFNKVDLAKTQLPGTGFAQLASLCFLVIHLCAHGEFKQVDSSVSEVFRRLFSGTKCAGAESGDPAMLLSKYTVSCPAASASAPLPAKSGPRATAPEGSRIKPRVAPVPAKAFVVVSTKPSAPRPARATANAGGIDGQVPIAKTPTSQKRAAPDPSPEAPGTIPRKSLRQEQGDDVPVSPVSETAPAAKQAAPPAFPARIRIVLKRPPSA
jgi:hypothetical protein